MATHSSILAWEIPWTSSYSPQSCKESDTTELTHQQASVSLKMVFKVACKRSPRDKRILEKRRGLMVDLWDTQYPESGT